MENTEPARGPGRPTKYSDRLERVQVLVTKEQRADAEKQAKALGCSISEVYRRWLEVGRSRQHSENYAAE